MLISSYLRTAISKRACRTGANRLRRDFLRFSAVAAAPAVAGCSGADILNLFASDDGVRVLKDIPYGEGARRTLDIYLPEKTPVKKLTVIFYYGGSWQEGKKESYRFLGNALAAAGYSVVIPDYRVYPQAVYPGFLEDCAAAARFMFPRIKGFGGGAEGFVLAGHSAGAYNAAMLALDDRYFAPVADKTPQIKGLISLAGPHQFLPPTDTILKKVFHEAVPADASQPAGVAGPGAPPALILHGKKDRLVKPANAPALAEALRAAGTEATVKLYPKGTHTNIIASVTDALYFPVTPTLADILRFLASVTATEYP